MKGFQSFDPLQKHGLVAFAWNSIWHLTKVVCYPAVCRWASSNAEAHCCCSSGLLLLSY